ncbi:MAG: YgaP family membrane protein [Anaerolineae bacterium]
MEVNVGDRDRLLRLIFGIYAMLLGFLFIQGVIGTIVGVVGLVLLVTGLVRRCGIYTLLGISTVSEEAAAQEAVAQEAVAQEAANEETASTGEDTAETVEADDVHQRSET